MEKKGTWKRVKSTIHRWYVAFLRSLGLRKEEPYENRHTDTPPDSPGVPPVPMPDISPLSPEGFLENSISADIICKRLEHLSKKRLFSVRKNGNRAEWKVRPANFVDAYLFLLSIPRVEVSRLTTRRIGDKTVISVSFQDGGKIELINKKILSEKKLFLRLTKGKECLLTIYFINSKKM